MLKKDVQSHSGEPKDPKIQRLVWGNWTGVDALDRSVDEVKVCFVMYVLSVCLHPVSSEVVAA